MGEVIEFKGGVTVVTGPPACILRLERDGEEHNLRLLDGDGLR
jgi:hypothetical protein